jgi:putative nucleotidyltransferase with HDIG domain
MNESILFVDDEKQILDALKRTFFNSRYNLFFAESGVEALNILEKEKIDLLISDAKMPGMDGYQLLVKVKEKYPSTIRMVLSGYADEKLIVEIQGKGLAKRFLYKPWKNEELIRMVGQLFKVEKLLKDRNLLELINKIEFLPSPGNIYQRFNMIIEQDADIDKIAKIVESDQAIAAKILQVANSAIYGVNTGSVKKAIAVLEPINVKYIILCAITEKNKNSLVGSRINREINILWKHTISTNQILTHLYSRIIGKKIPEIYSMVGLLHDIGKIVLMNYFPDRYLKAAAAIRNKKDWFYFYEKMEFTDTTHGELGAYLLNWWELPQPIVEAVLYHHNPLDENVIDRELLSLLYVSGIYSWNYLCEGDYWDTDPEVLELLNISKEELDRVVGEIKSDLDKFKTYRWRIS